MESISNFFVWRMAVLVLIYRVSFIKTWIGVIAICVILSMVSLILAIFGIQYIKNSHKH